jgi:hypothetical protein
MELLAAATAPATTPAQPPPYQAAPSQQQMQQYQQYQSTMQQPSAPVYRPSLAAKAVSWGFLLGYICLLIFMVVMVYRFVKATEKIADKMEKGIIVRKEDTPAQS